MFKGNPAFILFCTIGLLLGNNLFAQTNFFSAITTGDLPAAREATRQMKNKGIFRLDEQAMRNYLLSAPMEFRNNGITLPLEIPLPNGKTEIFSVVESPILSPTVAARHPEIKTYTGNGQKDKKSIIRLSLTSNGFNAILLNVEGDAVYFESYSKSQPGIYFNYFAKDAIAPAGVVTRGANCRQDLLKNDTRSIQHNIQPTPGIANRLNTGATLTTFRLAMAATAEFVAQYGDITDGFNAVVAYVNRIEAFYRNELSVSFTLVSDENLIYDDPGTDPYDNDDQGAMLQQNQDNCDAVLSGSANYDIGHVWGYVGGSGGGVAFTGVVCDVDFKGQGVSGEGDLADYSQVFMDQLVFHEMGHQFGMSHSYNSSIPVCTTREPSTSVEPGAGATVMSYGFTCGTDDYFTTPPPQTGPILQFHTVNYSQAVDFISTISCGTTTVTGNTPPVVTMPSAYTIPISTPFVLSGSATDDGSAAALTYCWEGTNIGDIIPPDATTLADPAEPPFFRTYEVIPSATRTYPLLSAILDGSNNAIGDKLPSVGIATTHNLTVRDNNAAGGGVAFGSVTITVDDGIGPFLETTNLSGTYPALSTQTITWYVNGTAAATPNVKISLSTDGGFTFPTTLLASTANDGSEVITLPNMLTSMARIKVEAIGNIFFDISNSDFTITNALPVQLVSFNVSLQRKNDALLKWVTASESDSKGYEIEMTQSSLPYRKMGFVEGKGTTSLSSNYEFVVPNLLSGVYYLRLKMIDIDGKFTYSSVQKLKIVSENDLVHIYPNPTHDGWFKIELADANNKKISVEIINAVGQVISRSDFFNYPNPINMKIAGGPGVYNIRITTNDGVTILKKIVTLK
jgi:hypothetical protein